MSEETIPQMRETIERLSKDKAGLQKENSELQTQVRVRDAREAFRTAGYEPSQGDLFVAANPDGEITVESVNEFATQFKIQPAESSGGGDGGSNEEDPASQEPAGSTNLAPASGGGSRPGDSAGSATEQTMTRAEYMELAATDPAAARAAVASGRVEISGDNPWLREPSTGRKNPYVPLVKT
jgi:hypothetical protein